MGFKDLNQYRANRKESKIVQNWLNNYKQSIMNDVVFRESLTYYSFNEEWSKLVEENPKVAEIVADTIIGWLNSPVGRNFISESFDVKVSQGNDGLENWECS